MIITMVVIISKKNFRKNIAEKFFACSYCPLIITKVRYEFDFYTDDETSIFESKTVKKTFLKNL